MNARNFQLLSTPASTSLAVHETLAYVDAYDAVLDLDYAFVAYKETPCDSGDWRVRIKSSQTAGAVFEPAMILGHARSTAAQGRAWFQWGYSFDPTPGDPRNIQFRVHVRDGVPVEIEILVQLRQFDHSPAPLKAVRFPWPSS